MRFILPEMAVQQSVFLLCFASSSSVTCNNLPLVPEIFGVLFIVRIQSINPIQHMYHVPKSFLASLSLSRSHHVLGLARPKSNEIFR